MCFLSKMKLRLIAILADHQLLDDTCTPANAEECECLSAPLLVLSLLWIRIPFYPLPFRIRYDYGNWRKTG